MNEIEKAIEYLKWRYEVHGGKIKLYQPDGSTKAYELAIQALEKQIPKQLIEESEGCGLCKGVSNWYQFLSGNLPNEPFYYCPRCGRKIEHKESEVK